MNVDFINLNLHALSVGVPSQLLLYRRDIQQAEREIAAAGLDVLSTRARFFPRLDITGTVGYEAFNPRYLFNPDAYVANVAGGLIVPLFNRNAIQADYQTANARQLQAVYNYQRVVLSAFTEVINSLAKVEKLPAERRDQEAAVGLARNVGGSRRQPVPECPHRVRRRAVRPARPAGRTHGADRHQAAAARGRGRRVPSPRRRGLADERRRDGPDRLPRRCRSPCPARFRRRPPRQPNPNWNSPPPPPARGNSPAAGETVGHVTLEGGKLDPTVTRLAGGDPSEDKLSVPATVPPATIQSGAGVVGLDEYLSPRRQLPAGSKPFRSTGRRRSLRRAGPPNPPHPQQTADDATKTSTIVGDYAARNLRKSRRLRPFVASRTGEVQCPRGFQPPTRGRIS